jgi:hypothetical protein
MAAMEPTRGVGADRLDTGNRLSTVIQARITRYLEWPVYQAEQT